MSDKLKAIQEKIARKNSPAHAELIHSNSEHTASENNQRLLDTSYEQMHKTENAQMLKTAIEKISDDIKKEEEETKLQKKRATFEFDEDFHTEVKLYATRHRKKMVDVVVAAIKKYMHENP